MWAKDTTKEEPFKKKKNFNFRLRQGSVWNRKFVPSFKQDKKRLFFHHKNNVISLKENVLRNVKVIITAKQKYYILITHYVQQMLKMILN